MAMRILGIDYGSKRVGTALTDDKGMMAFPHEVFPNDAKLIVNLEGLIKEKGVGEIVIGHSLGRDGQPSNWFASAPRTRAIHYSRSHSFPG